MYALALHEWHPIFVHFTVALVLSATLIYTATYLLKNNRCYQEAFIVLHWMLCLGGLASLGTIASGFIAFDAVEHDMFSHIEMVNHRNWALITFVFMVIIAIWAFVRHLHYKTNGWQFLIALLICSLFVTITAYKGGRLVYVHGIGVHNKPAPEKKEPRENIFEIEMDF